MADRPTAQELIEAARMHLESAVIPAVRADRKLYFQTLVAINVLRIVEREMEMGADHAQAEWRRLNSVEGVEPPMPASERDLRAALDDRNAAVCGDIRAGRFDGSRVLYDHLEATVIDQLQVVNPRFLMTLINEAQNPELDAWNNRT